MAKYKTTMKWPGTIYITSDLHIGDAHVDISDRKFPDCASHNLAVYKALKSKATNGNTLVVLGDLGRGDWIKIISSLKCYKVLILGNHDTKSKGFYENYFNEVYEDYFPLTKNVVGSHYPIEVPDYIVNIHGHLHGASLSLPNYINANISDNNFELLNLEEIEIAARKLTRNDTKFLNEWYEDYHIFDGRKLGAIGVDANQHYYKIHWNDEDFECPTSEPGIIYAIGVKKKEDGILSTNIIKFANKPTVFEEHIEVDEDEEVLLIQYKGDTIVSIKIKEEK